MADRADRSESYEDGTAATGAPGCEQRAADDRIRSVAAIEERGVAEEGD